MPPPRTCALVVVAALLAAATAWAQTSETAAQAAARIRSLQREADGLANQSRTLLGELRRLELERQISRDTLAAANLTLESMNGNLDAARARVARLEAQRGQAAPALAAELVQIYKHGRRRTAQVLLASASDSRALGRLVHGVAILAAAERVQITQHRQTLAAERDAVAELERQQAAAAASRETQIAAQATLDRAVAERNRLVDAIDRERDLAARYGSELRAAQLALEPTVSGLSTVPVRPAAAPVTLLKGDLDWPVRGVVRSRFTGRSAAQPGRPAQDIVRSGIEVTATEGASVRAVGGGRISYAAPLAGLGTVVVVDHSGGVQSLYGHLERLTVADGTTIGRGAVIGQVGLTPAGAAALYFELRVDGQPVDPLQWLRSSP